MKNPTALTKSIISMAAAGFLAMYAVADWIRVDAMAERVKQDRAEFQKAIRQAKPRPPFPQATPKATPFPHMLPSIQADGTLPAPVLKFLARKTTRKGGK